MARPLRPEFPGALYHVTTRGALRVAVYEDDKDRRAFLDILGGVVADFNWFVHAYCLMDNQYHLLIETPNGNLAKGMRQLNGVYTQWSNRRHGRAGHLFQGRYKAILVDRDPYLLELSRYIVLTPVRARLVKAARLWQWSSYRPMMGVGATPKWLSVGALLDQFGSRRSVSRKRYERFVAEGLKVKSPWNELKGQIYLGDERFVKRMQLKLERQADDINLSLQQRRAPALALKAIARAHKDRNRAILKAYDTGNYSYSDIADHLKLHFTTVGRIVRAGRKTNRQAGEISKR